jgi:hypothetical protein
MSATGAVVGNGLVSLSAGIKRQDREDLFDCLLRAERVAGQVSRDQHFTYWAYRYGMALEQRSFVKLSPIMHAPMVIRSASELEEISFSVIESRGSARLARQALASLQAVRIHRYAAHFFESINGNTLIAGFQVIPCALDPAGNVMVLLCGIQMTGNVETRDFDFWSESRSELTLRITGGAYRFDRRDYARHRDAVARELDGHSARAIQTFAI